MITSIPKRLFLTWKTHILTGFSHRNSFRQQDWCVGLWRYDFIVCGQILKHFLKKNHQKILKISDFRKFRPEKNPRNLRFFENLENFRKFSKISKFHIGFPLKIFENFRDFRKNLDFSKNLKFRGNFFGRNFLKFGIFNIFWYIFF